MTTILFALVFQVFPNLNDNQKDKNALSKEMMVQQRQVAMSLNT